MGFKWFKARMPMNRMPAHSSAVAGSYKTTSSFDAPDFVSNNGSTRTNGHLKVKQKSNLRPVSMPVLNNPLAERASRGGAVGGIPPSMNTAAQKSSVMSTQELNSDEENDYHGVGVENPVLLTADITQMDYNRNIEKSTPKPVSKTHMAEYRKKKNKAPMPKLKLDMKAANRTGQGDGQYILIKNDRKSSHASDIDV